MKQTLTAREAIRSLSSYAFDGAKIPHSVSNPVFRRLPDGRYALAAFAFTFTREMLADSTANPPSEWILIDPVTGELISRIACSEEDFVDFEKTVVDLRPESGEKFSKDYSAATLYLLDRLLSVYGERGEFDKGLNDAYMYMMLRPVSVGLKPYYKALNKI